MEKELGYTQAIIEAVNSLFDEESELQKYEGWDKVDLTSFFTAYIMAGNYMFNTLTGDDKNNLEFTHLVNQLIVQYMLRDKGAA